MECFVLGSGGMMPMPKRRLTSVAVRAEGQVYLFDCGEGTQVPYKELHVGLRSLTLVAVTHLHADHCLGLPGLLMLRAQMPEPGPLRIVGPPGLGRFVSHVRRDLSMYINYPVQVHEWSEEAGPEAYRDERLRVLWEPVHHTTFCLGFRLEEHQRPGRFDPRAATALGVPKGPAWGELQRGQPVTLPDGQQVRPDAVLGPPRRGRRLAYVTDTAETPAIERLLQGTDLAFLESMFLNEEQEEARSKLHLTAGQAARLAARAGVRRLVLVHISPRYDLSQQRRFEQQAREHHPQVVVARDGEQLQLPLPPETEG